MSATASMRPTSEILAAMKTALEAVRYTPPGGDELVVFQTVKIYDRDDLVAAFKELLLSSQRIALIIADKDAFEQIGGGMKLLFNREQLFYVLTTDRVHGDRNKALYGDLAANPPVLGAERMARLAIPAVTGQLLDAPDPIHCVPDSLDVNFVEDSEKKLQGRACMQLNLVCTGGEIEARLTTPKL